MRETSRKPLWLMQNKLHVVMITEETGEAGRGPAVQILVRM